MKKRYLSIFILPVLALASCGGNGISIRGTITNGTAVTDAKKQQAADVSSEDKQTAQETANKGFTAAASFVLTTTEVANGMSGTMAMNLGFTLDVDITNPYLKAVINGAVGASMSGQGSYSVNVSGLSEARKNTGSTYWNVLSDSLVASYNGQTANAGEGGLLYSMGNSSSANGAEYLFNLVTDGIYSWDFDFTGESFDLSKLGNSSDSVSSGLVNSLYMSGDPSTGSFEIGIVAPYRVVIDNQGGNVVITKFRYAYQNYLLSEFVTAFAMNYASQGASASVTYECGFHMTYR